MRFTVTASERGLDVAAEGGKPIQGPLYGQLVAVAATRDLARLGWDGEPLVTRRQPVQRMGRAWVAPPPGGFLQATRQGEAALVAAVREAVGRAARIADLFAGSGTFALPLAEGAEVMAADADEGALAALDAGWREADGLKRITTERRNLLSRPLLVRELSAFDAIVLDPPRAGARSQVEQIAASPVPRVAAVSCNPATFARDARTLIDGGYRLDWVLPVDQFRWSPHVELAAAFSRAA
jgi:23S rRNA (uracil1939-C5)-methyltransferase